MRAFLARPIKFSKGDLHFTARAGTPVHIVKKEEQTVLILFKVFMRWVNKKSVKEK